MRGRYAEKAGWGHFTGGLIYVSNNGGSANRAPGGRFPHHAVVHPQRRQQPFGPQHLPRNQ